ncbi:hypothetical protein QVD17_06188 [Tagetes erecta]|uniref:HMA domain-containing protein n=1 Tax=Tagetes erecta TaxID=13708 RepID=A0AAD8LIX0_TARER|nr:hypothetical protein QVD17_06188 [Tagetes erecta]
MQRQEIKIKVNMHSEKCRRGVMKTVTKLSGVDQVSVDLPKEMLVVIGDVDPVCVTTSLRKKKWVAKIISVGPKKPKDDDKKIVPIMYCNDPCGYGYGYYPPCPPVVHHGDQGCNIL